MSPQAPLLIAGSHGKTTTTALLAWVLLQAGWDPSYAIGGRWQKEALPHGRWGRGLYFVAEADESDGTFLRYRGRGAILTNCGADHLDHFQTLDRLKDAFARFAQTVPPSGLLWCCEDPGLSSLPLQGSSYGEHPDAEWRLVRWHSAGWSTRFTVKGPKAEYHDLEIPLPGRHIALNATAVVAMAHRLGVPPMALRQALATFPGVGRRCHVLLRDPVTVIQDYGHHPTEIATTLSALRQAFPNRSLKVVFQPHRYTRTQHLLEEFPHAFVQADSILTTDIYAASEPPIPGIDGESFAAKMREHYPDKALYASRQGLASVIRQWVAPSDVVVMMGAGDIEEVAIDVAHALQAEGAVTDLLI